VLASLIGTGATLGSIAAFSAAAMWRALAPASEVEPPQWVPGSEGSAGWWPAYRSELRRRLAGDDRSCSKRKCPSGRPGSLLVVRPSLRRRTSSSEFRLLRRRRSLLG
jgi:hypothetical protein